MSLSVTSIRHPIFAWMLMISLILFGGLCFRGMGISQLPDVDFPMVNISLRWDGASPESMELDVVDIVESSVLSVEGVKKISSNSKRGNADISVEFDLDKDIDVAVQEIQSKINQVQKRLPVEMDPAVVTKSNPEDRPIMWLSVTADNWQVKDLMRYVQYNLKDRFQTIPGVSDIILGGFVGPNLRVWTSQEKLNRYDLTVSDVLNAIKHEHSEPPAGNFSTPTQEFNVRTMGEAKSVEEFGKIYINRRGGGPNFTPLPLKQVADIHEGLADITRISRVMGKQSVGLGIRKVRGSNSVEVGKKIKEKMEKIRPSLPPGLDLGVNFDSTTFIEDSVKELIFTLTLSAFLTAIVCWIFLGSWSATFNVIMAIPTSVIGTFIILKYFNFTLNTFTLLGLSLAIGIVVDDAIMVLENIFRHFEEDPKKDRVKAALGGAQEITFAALAATLAIVAIFLPVAFMKGLMGKYFFQFGVTISAAVMLSLLEALTLTPMRCSQWMDAGERTTRIGKLVEGAFKVLENFYGKFLSKILRFRYLTVFCSLFFFASTYYLVKLLRKEFVPPQDTGSLMIRVKTKEGSSLTYTDEQTKSVENYLKSRAEVKRYFAAIGGFGGSDSNAAMFFVTLHELKHRPIPVGGKKPLRQQELAQIFRDDLKKLQGFKAFVQDPSLGGFGSGQGYPVELTIRGPNWNKLIDISKELMKEMEKTQKMVDVNSDYKGELKEIRIIPNRERAALRGVALEDIGMTVGALVAGVVAGSFAKDGRRYDIRVKIREEEMQNLDDIKKIRVRNNRGELIPLSQVVDIIEADGPMSLTRQDRERAIGIQANLATGASQAQVMEEVKVMAKKLLPSEYSLGESGTAETFKESFQSLIFALILGLIVSYMVLASQFNSLLHPITVLMALPFSVSGAFMALYGADQSLNIYSMIGLILLMGIVKKNSIILVDFTNQVLGRKGDHQGREAVREALIEACPKRLRPILMTSVATVVGAIPAAFSLGPGSESLIPMGLSIIGGVSVSTVLTLLVVPCLYEILSFGHGKKSSQLRDIKQAA